MMIRIVLTALVLALTACSTVSPKAWERGNLAKPEMAWDPDPMQAGQRSHVYTSKEHSTGGASAGGGGCGCSN